MKKAYRIILLYLVTHLLILRHVSQCLRRVSPRFLASHHRFFGVAADAVVLDVDNLRQHDSKVIFVGDQLY